MRPVFTFSRYYLFAQRSRVLFETFSLSEYRFVNCTLFRDRAPVIDHLMKLDYFRLTSPREYVTSISKGHARARAHTHTHTHTHTYSLTNVRGHLIIDRNR